MDYYQLEGMIELMMFVHACFMAEVKKILISKVGIYICRIGYGIKVYLGSLGITSIGVEV